MKSIIAQFLSVVLHPFFIPAYGIVLLFNSFLAIFVATSYQLIIFGFVFLFTCVIPLILSLIMLKTGYINDIEIQNRKERTLPYLISFLSGLTCTFLLYRLGVPLWILAFMIGYSAIIVLLCIINIKWKISAHLAGFGGLCGAIFGIAYALQLNPFPVFMLIVLIAGALAWARIELKSHTPLQTLAGFLLGFIGIFLSIALCV